MSEKKEKYTVVVLAAGKGTRMGGSVAKQFLEIGGKPVVVYALEVFEHSPEIDQIILVTGADKIEYCQKEIIEKYGIKKTVSVCAGGRERYESVWKALQTLKSLESEQEQKTDYVLIHDGARPFLNQEMLERLCACVKEEKACVLGMPVKDTIKLTDENGKIRESPRMAGTDPAGLCSRASVSGIRKTDAAFHRRNHRRCHGCGAGDGNRISDGKRRL